MPPVVVVSQENKMKLKVIGESFEGPVTLTSIDIKAE